MMRKILFFSLIAVFSFSCVQKKEVLALQKQIIDIKKEISRIKKQQTYIKQTTEQLALRVDDLSKSVSKNSIKIEKLKTVYKPPKNPPLEGEEIVKKPKNPKEIYNKALDLYYEGKLEESEEKFKEFLTNFKGNKLYDNAIFWLGQIYYTKGEYEKAIKQFKFLIKICEKGKLKDCNKEPIALLKLAYSYLKLGRKKEGKKYLQKLVKNFPKTEEASIAQRKLEELK